MKLPGKPTASTGTKYEWKTFLV